MQLLFFPTANDNGLFRAFILSSPLAGHHSAVFLCACEKHLQCHFTALASNRCEGGQLLLWCLVPHQKAQIIHVKLQFTSLRSPFDIGAHLILHPGLAPLFSWCKRCCVSLSPLCSPLVCWGPWSLTEKPFLSPSFISSARAALISTLDLRHN